MFVSVTGRSTVGRLTYGFGRPLVDWWPKSVDLQSTDPTNESYSNFLLIPRWSLVDSRSIEYWYRSTASRPLKVGRLNWLTCYYNYRFQIPVDCRSTDVLIGRLPVDWCTHRSDCRGVSSPFKSYCNVKTPGLVDWPVDRSLDRSTVGRLDLVWLWAVSLKPNSRFLRYT